MYRLIGLKRLGSLYAVLVFLIAIGLFAYHAITSPIALGLNHVVFYRLAASLFKGLSTVSFLFWLVGQTSAFVWLCRHTALSHVFPDLDGTWTGTTASNWPLIVQRHEGKELPSPLDESCLQSTPMEIQITARLLSLSMTMVSHNAYSSSKTVSLDIAKDPEHKTIALRYLYHNTTPVPLATDSGQHWGAAILELDPRTGSLNGDYWTNRNWSKAENTAGRVHLSRAAKT